MITFSRGGNGRTKRLSIFGPSICNDQGCQQKPEIIFQHPKKNFISDWNKKDFHIFVVRTGKYTFFQPLQTFQ
jgi:hypothetical protein